jgi:hypothetical protein
MLPHTDKDTKKTSEDDDVIRDAWKDSHAFEGSKIKFSGKNLGSVDAAQASTDIVVLD